ncbi:MAG: type II toxin-antitoxin system prevent-host-death family antitoxin [Pseudomonadota bacterium]
MTITTMSSRDFNQDTGRAKKVARRGPVVITDRGRNSHVLLTFKDFERMAGKQRSMADLLAMRKGADIEFDPPKLGDVPLAARFS